LCLTALHKFYILYYILATSNINILSSAEFQSYVMNTGNYACLD